MSNKYKESVGRSDINNVYICVGDTVFCWDGKKDQSEMTESLVGIVTKVEHPDGLIQYEVAGNNMALGCAEHVEIIEQEDK